MFYKFLTDDLRLQEGDNELRQSIYKFKQNF